MEILIMWKEFKKAFKRPFIFEQEHRVYHDVGVDLSVARFNDIDELMRLQKLIYPDHQPWTRQTYIYELTRRNNIYLLLKNNNQLIGMMGVSKKNRHEAHITNIGIIPDFQNQGLGHLVLDICFKMVRESEFTKLSLEVDALNIRAIKLYKSLGFYEIKKMNNYYDNGHDGLELCKQMNK